MLLRQVTAGEPGVNKHEAGTVLVGSSHSWSKLLPLKAEDSLSVLNRSGGECIFFIKATSAANWNSVRLKVGQRSRFLLASRDTFDIACECIDPLGGGRQYRVSAIDLHKSFETPDDFPLPFGVSFAVTATKQASPGADWQRPSSRLTATGPELLIMAKDGS